MRFRQVFLIVQCAMFVLMLGKACVADQPQSQQGILLKFKFIKGHILRYKMVSDIDISIQSDMPNMSQIPSIAMKTVMVMKQKVIKILPNGDAEMAVSVESMKLDMMGNTQIIPCEQMPQFTMVISPTGEIKGVKGLEELNTQMGGQIPFQQIGNWGQMSVVFPSTPVKLGDSWIQKVPFPMGDGNIDVKTTLSSTDSKIGSYNVVVLDQKSAGDIGMNFGSFMPSGDQSSDTPDIGMTADFDITGKVYFSPDTGFTIRATGSGNIAADMDITDPSTETASGKMMMNMLIEYEMFKLPSK